MKAEPFVVSPKTYQPALHVLGVSVTALALNIQTRGLDHGRRGELAMCAGHRRERHAFHVQILKDEN